MPVSSPRQVPGTPRVISPSPDPSEHGEPAPGDNSYFSESDVRGANGRPTTPSKNRTGGKTIRKGSDPSADPEYRARSRSRDIDSSLRKRRASGLTPLVEDVDGMPNSASDQAATPTRRKTGYLTVPNGSANGHLSPGSAMKNYWRELSRSPSPLGLIPIHREWRSFVHRHEIPRKGLHVSIGFLTLWFYAHGYQLSDFHPIMLGLLIPITLVDIVRHNWPRFNRFYIRAMGAFMRESEAHDKYNGVIWYLIGAYVVLRFCPKDVGVMCICLLSWCDTAASTFGRLWGRYTPRIRRGKSLAGSLAAFVFGVSTAVMFWGWLAPRYEMLGRADNSGVNEFAFQGRLGLSSRAKQLPGMGVGKETGYVSGGLALGMLSVWAGFVASASEAVDVFGLDDNVTIPILCGIGLWGFLKLFGSA